MKVMHRISFPGDKEFEQHEAQFTLEDSDIAPEFLNGCNLAEKMFLFNVLVLFEGLLFQVCEGYIDGEEMKKRKARIFGLLSPKLREVVKSVLKNHKEEKDG
jgi:hypothetical protein